MRIPFRSRPAAPMDDAGHTGRGPNRGRTPWRLAHFCVVDLELSGLDPKHDEIISIRA